MRALDTSILARWVLRDDAEQADLADRLLAEPFYLSPSVLAELGWVMKSIGGMARDQMAQALGSLLGLPTAYAPHAENLRWAVERFARQGDWADLLHIAVSTDADCFATFDKRIARNAGPNSPLPVWIPAEMAS